MYYNIEEMIFVSSRLESILTNEISEKTLREFQLVALSLNWQGRAAESFRENVSQICYLLSQNNTDMYLINELKELAKEPRKKAYLMQQADESEAARIRSKFLF